MEFEFVRDVTGELRAHFSLGSEAVGAWLMEEVGDSQTALQSVLAAIGKVRSGELREYRLAGSEYSLRLTGDEAEICDARIDFDGDDLLNDEAVADDLDYYDAEAKACIGLDDFEEMLWEWQRFLP